jgi:rod shape determining protein RodA
LAIGEGGLTGVHNTDYSESNLKFLPEPQTDFIFAVTSEHTGFIGAGLLLAGYALLLTRLIFDATSSRDRAGMLVIMASVGGLAFQIFINIGMALGILPVVGVPLPLMSAGLATLIATFLFIGFAISVRLRRFVN